MTACALISPDGILQPSLISDVAVTFEGTNTIDSRPGRLTIANQGRPDPRLYLARKTYILSPQAAIAVSGREMEIGNFLRAAGPLLEQAALGQRPMREIGALADAFAGHVDVVGAYVPDPDDEGKVELNFVRPNRLGTAEIGRLGKVSAIGSGRHALLRLLGEFERRIPEGEHVSSKEAARLLNQQRIYTEIYGGANVNPNWGGFVETTYYDSGTRSWLRQESVLCVHYQASYANGVFSDFGIINRIIAYDPSNSGRILTVLGDEAGKLYFTDYVIRDLLNPATSVASTEDYWARFVPSKVLVTTVIGTKFLGKGIFNGSAGFGAFDTGPEDPAYLIVQPGLFQLHIHQPALEAMFETARESVRQGGGPVAGPSPYPQPR